jgi:DNA-binding beta-propeller fold protein YncE
MVKKINNNWHNGKQFQKTLFCLMFCSLLFVSNNILGQVNRVEIGKKSTPANTEVYLELIHRFQHYNPKPKSEADIYDETIDSPKSANILDNKNKFYIHSLEGCETSVYRLSDLTRLKTIKHKFDKTNQFLFKETNYFDYKFRTKKENLNYFSGKPVESCFSHNGKYLWVTYYRRTYDTNAIDPSALCIIDTEADTIVRVMPTAPLPKMIACSPDSKTIAVTHWGDNTMSLINIDSDNPNDFYYLKHIVVDYQMSLNFEENVNRDENCGHCLRGTVFTPDNKYVFIGKMGGGSIAVIDVANQKYIGSIAGMKTNLRHLVINGNYIYLSINKAGYVQRAKLTDFVAHINKIPDNFTDWQSVYVGEGARTIVVSPNGKYVFAAINNKSKITVVRTSDMKVVAECSADSYPVGMDISADGKFLIVTAQGRNNDGGNSVMIYKINEN